MKLKNIDKSTWGKKLILPNMGLVDIPDGGEFDVEDELGKSLVANGGGSWQDASEASEDGGEDVEQMLATIDTMSVEEMVELAKQANLKGYDKIKNKPEVLRTFIKNKLKK